MNIPIITYDEKQNLNDFLDKIKIDNNGQKVLICGHSNTIPHMLNILLKDSIYEDFPPDRYNDIFLISVMENIPAVVTTLNIEI